MQPSELTGSLLQDLLHWETARHKFVPYISRTLTSLESRPQIGCDVRAMFWALARALTLDRRQASWWLILYRRILLS